MPRKIGNIIVIFALTAGAVLAGYEFLTINLNVPFLQREVPPEPEPVFTVETLPDEQMAAGENAVVETAPVTEGESVRAFVVDYIVKDGAKMLDSKAFATKDECTNAVATVINEYRRRGIPDKDIAETVSFPGSDGIVMLVTNGGLLYFVGCMTQQTTPWTTYVHYMPLDGQQ